MYFYDNLGNRAAENSMMSTTASHTIKCTFPNGLYFNERFDKMVQSNKLLYDIKEHELFLSNIDPIIVHDKIRYFRSLNIKNLSNSEISKEIADVLCVGGMFIYRPNIATYPSGTEFFRVRKLSIHDNNFKKYSDFWEPPQNCVKNYGRLNKVGEALLYVSPMNPWTAINEMKIDEDSPFALIKYVSNSDVKVNIIGGVCDYTTLGFTNKNAIFIHEIYNDFFRDEFSRDVGVGTEHLYRVSEIIAKQYFDLPPRDAQDAWAYSSVQDKTKYNVCFRPEIAHDLLNLHGAMICRIKNDDIMVHCIAVGTENEDIKYCQLGSEEQQHLFPEICKPKTL